MSKRYILSALLGTAIIGLAGCMKQPNEQPQASDHLTQARESAADQAQREVTESYEIDNILARRLLFGKPGVIGYVAFFGGMGQPIQYLTVKGKCTSSNKRLTPGEVITNGDYNHQFVMRAPGEDGTFGTSDEYIYCFATNGTYDQWNGPYLYSSKPFELTTPPIVISVQSRDDKRVQGQ